MPAWGQPKLCSTASDVLRLWHHRGLPLPVALLQGEALPFQGTVAQLMEKLVAAGVGQRPVVFVSHRQVAAC